MSQQRSAAPVAASKGGIVLISAVFVALAALLVALPDAAPEIAVTALVGGAAAYLIMTKPAESAMMEEPRSHEVADVKEVQMDELPRKHSRGAAFAASLPDNSDACTSTQAAGGDAAASAPHGAPTEQQGAPRSAEAAATEPGRAASDAAPSAKRFKGDGDASAVPSDTFKSGAATPAPPQQPEAAADVMPGAGEAGAAPPSGGEVRLQQPLQSVTLGPGSSFKSSTTHSSHEQGWTSTVNESGPGTSNTTAHAAGGQATQNSGGLQALSNADGGSVVYRQEPHEEKYAWETHNVEPALPPAN